MVKKEGTTNDKPSAMQEPIVENNANVNAPERNKMCFVFHPEVTFVVFLILKYCVFYKYLKMVYNN